MYHKVFLKTYSALQIAVVPRLFHSSIHPPFSAGVPAFLLVQGKERDEVDRAAEQQSTAAAEREREGEAEEEEE